jgi:hypothetical protein
VPIVLKSGSLNLLEPSGPVQACNGIALPLPLQYIYIQYTSEDQDGRIPKLTAIMEVCVTDIQRIVLAVCDHGAYHEESVRAKLRSLAKMHKFYLWKCQHTSRAVSPLYM